jgi:protein-tyrosine-phosphatase/DNA-binding transcriptional ArsR family regulator
MVKNGAPAIFKLLANNLRWNILNHLTHSDMRVQELSALLHQPQNLVSYHLHKLHEHGLIVEHRSIADGREVYYGVNWGQIRKEFKTTETELHPGLVDDPGADRSFLPYRVLFLCTHNSARSQMAEGFLRDKSHHQIQALSAGTEPLPVHPNAIQVMAEHQIDIHGQQSKSLEAFLSQQFDYVITVCDLARESCPTFPGNPVQIHWSIADPVSPSGASENHLQTFRATAAELEERVDYFLFGIRPAGKADP